MNFNLKKTGIRILSLFMVAVFLFSINLTQWVYSEVHPSLKGQVTGLKSGKVHDTDGIPLCPPPINSEESTDVETLESLETADDDIVLSAFLNFLCAKLGDKNFSKKSDQTSGVRRSIPFFILFHSWKGFLN